MKRTITFALPAERTSQKSVAFAEIEGGIEADFVVFSTAFNRNKAYFQVSDLMRNESIMEKLMTDFNHDLSLSGGKHLGNLNSWSNLRSRFVDGVLEIVATFRSTDPQVIARKEEITGCSIELYVDDEDIISNEYGEYYRDFEWAGVALLLGIAAGSGNTRMLEMRTFSADGALTPLDSQATFMNEEQVKALLAEQKSELVKEFSQIVAQSQNEESSVWEWIDENGNKYKITSKEICQSITELVETGTMGESALVSLMSAKGYKLEKYNQEAEPESQGEVKEDETPEPATEPEVAPQEPTKEEVEAEEQLKAVEHAAKAIETAKNFGSQAELVSEAQPAEEAAEEVKQYDIGSKVKEKLKNISF